MFDPPVPETTTPVDSAALLAQLRNQPTPELEATFRELDTLENATSAHKLMVLTVLDEREVGRDDGALDAIGWVSWTARVTRSRARALVDTARALPDRPEIATVALEGRLSGEQLEAVVQVATPETDATWAADAPGWTATSLRAAARNRRVDHDRRSDRARDRRRELGYRWDERTRGAPSLGSDPRRRRSPGRRRARTWSRRGSGPTRTATGSRSRCAARTCSSTSLTSELERTGEAHRATVDRPHPRGRPARRIRGAGRLPRHRRHRHPDRERDRPAARVRRDPPDRASRTPRVVPLRLGRRTRTVPRYLFRLLKHRDRHCRAPGCTRTLGLHAHHVVHWADGGETNLDNLILAVQPTSPRVARAALANPRSPQPPRDRSSSDDPTDARVTPYRPPPLDVRVRERLLVSTS